MITAALMTPALSIVVGILRMADIRLARRQHVTVGFRSGLNIIGRFRHGTWESILVTLDWPEVVLRVELMVQDFIDKVIVFCYLFGFLVRSFNSILFHEFGHRSGEGGCLSHTCIHFGYHMQLSKTFAGTFYGSLKSRNLKSINEKMMTVQIIDNISTFGLDFFARPA